MPYTAGAELLIVISMHKLYVLTCTMDSSLKPLLSKAVCNMGVVQKVCLYRCIDMKYECMDIVYRCLSTRLYEEVGKCQCAAVLRFLSPSLAVSRPDRFM